MKDPERSVQEYDIIPSDIKAVQEAITALLASVRTAAIYPRGHSGTAALLERTFGLLQAILEKRQSLILTVIGDTLAVENCSLGKKNSSCRKMAYLFRKLNLAFLTFLPGFTMDELYTLHLLIAEQSREQSLSDNREILSRYEMKQIRIEFVDFSSFSVREGKASGEISQETIWEQYITGLLAGMLKTGKYDELENIPSDIFARIVCKMQEDDSYDKSATGKIFSAYSEVFFQRVLSKNDTKELLNFVNSLQPDLQEKFLDSVVSMLSKGTEPAGRSLQNISAEAVMALFESTDLQKAFRAESLKNLIDRLSDLARDGREYLNPKGSCFVDDIYMPADTLALVGKSELEGVIFDTFETVASPEYESEIQKLHGVCAPARFSGLLSSFMQACNDDAIDTIYHRVIFELMASDSISQEEYRHFIDHLREETYLFLESGQYGQVVRTMELFLLNIMQSRFANTTSEALQYYYTPEFFQTFIDSLKIVGRQARDEAWQLCDYYGESIIPFLVSAVADGDSQTFRSFLLGLLKQFDKRVIPAALEGLDDPRWFVKRNMLYLLNGQCEDEQIVSHVRPCCRHENTKVRQEALKCLMSLEGDHRIEVLREYLSSGSQEDVEQAISSVGIFRVRGAVPDLLRLIGEKGRSKTELARKLQAIRALGNIGDPSCLDAFREILSARSLILNANLTKMKEEVYKGLKNFPLTDIEDMVQSGLGSRNRSIREESQRLSRTGDIKWKA